VNLNALLIEGNIDPREVLVMRHRPYEPELRKVLPWLAAEKPDVFNAYQQTQGKKVEKAMHEMHKGTLKSGNSGKKVTTKKQAVAIGLSEARKEGGKVPKRKSSKTPQRGLAMSA